MFLGWRTTAIARVQDENVTKVAGASFKLQMFHMFICFNNITETRENATLHDIITFFQISFFSDIDAFIHYETKKIREYCQAAIQSRYFKKVSQMGRARKKQSCFDNN